MIQHLAVVGATGAVGREFCALLEERRLPARRITLVASARSVGKTLRVAGGTLEVQPLTEATFQSVDFAVFAAGGAVSRQYAPIAVSQGTVVVDNSSAFRMDAEVPLVVPEVNAADLKQHRGLVANPNCSAAILVLVLAPLHRVNPIQRVVVSTYQAASGAGAAAMQELRTQTVEYLSGRPVRPVVFPHPIAFNLFSHDSPVGSDGYNQEETKLVEETRKILHAPELAVAPTCVRVPVLRAHSESATLTFEHPITVELARETLAGAAGLKVVDDAEQRRFPMPVEASGRDAVLVGRIRRDLSQPDGRGLQLFLCGDQLRKGAALNAIQILEALTQPG
ncbi:MAG TPA: aspartate-semialdehyde dehydrogenase [Phycisphaerae bacterium]|nr:aspartate-semialdehyde dehydrogenase [Phycisphaerae bacterium]HNU45050.1 aspartate-semialdehyde dehydrogenase [Phycisphaerae bacterium]